LRRAKEERDFYFERVLGDAKMISQLDNLINNKNYQTEVNKDIGENFDLIISDYPKLQISLRASIEAIDEPMMAAIYSYSTTPEDERNPDVLAIALGKMLHAGFNAEGGVNGESSKALIFKYVEMVEKTFRHIALDKNVNFEQLVRDGVDKLIEDAELLSEINDYDAPLGVEFDDNLIVLAIRDSFNPRFHFLVYYFYDDGDTEYEFGNVSFAGSLYEYTQTDIELWYEAVSLANYGAYSFDEVRLHDHIDFIWDRDLTKYREYAPGNKIPTSDRYQNILVIVLSK